MCQVPKEPVGEGGEVGAGEGEGLEEVEGANDLSYHVHVQKILLQHRVELFPVPADDLDDVVDDVFAHCFPEL